MGKITNRRSRTPNWSVEEKQYLLELIKERKEVIVTKSGNGPNHSEEKDVAWNEILRELSVKFGNKFSSSSTKKVKTQWQNMKRIAREELSLNGTLTEKCSRQSLDVCRILEMPKDNKGVLKRVNDKSEDKVKNDVEAQVEVKAEPVDEDFNQPSCSGFNSNSMDIGDPVKETYINLLYDTSTSSVSEPDLEYEVFEETSPAERPTMINASVMTEIHLAETASNPFQRDIQDFFRFTSAEKQLKLETLKEERQVARAMRETAELNKIIAEQRLKHLLWTKKHEMSMYAGEPGSGAGKGGGGGGAIREAGGAFGKMEAAREDEYFYKMQKQQLKNLKGHLDKEISFHEEQIKRHEDAIRRHKEQMDQMEK